MKQKTQTNKQKPINRKIFLPLIALALIIILISVPLGNATVYSITENHYYNVLTSTNITTNLAHSFINYTVFIYPSIYNGQYYGETPQYNMSIEIINVLGNGFTLSFSQNSFIGNCTVEVSKMTTGTYSYLGDFNMMGMSPFKQESSVQINESETATDISISYLNGYSNYYSNFPLYWDGIDIYHIAQNNSYPIHIYVTNNNYPHSDISGDLPISFTGNYSIGTVTTSTPTTTGSISPIFDSLSTWLPIIIGLIILFAMITLATTVYIKVKKTTDNL